MKAINLKDITKALEIIIQTGMPDYVTERNVERNEDPNRAAIGWIGIYRHKSSYTPHTTGRRWLSTARIVIELQAASIKSQADAEDKLQDSEEALLDVIMADYTISGTVRSVKGIDIEYMFGSAENNIYFHMAVITIAVEKRTA